MPLYDALRICRKLDAPSAPAIAEIVESIRRHLPPGVEMIDSPNADLPVPEKTLFVAVGGDGTMLAAMKMARASGLGARILGFNTGKLGFLTDFAPDSVEATLSKAFSDELACDERHLLLASVRLPGDTESSQSLAVNEFSLANLYTGSILSFDLFIGGNFAGSHRADALIVATPTGSTAYALSAGGPVVDPSAPILQILPVAAATMTSRPIVASASQGVTVRLKPHPGETYSFKPDTQRALERRVSADHPVDFSFELDGAVTLLHERGWNFYDTLTRKLHWNRSVI